MLYVTVRNAPMLVLEYNLWWEENETLGEA